jgi:hypothetical protein
MIMALAITITANISFSELHLSHAQTLGNIKDLSIDATDAHDPRILLSGFNIYVIWVDFVTGNDDIYFKRSTDGGASFGNTINLSNDLGDSYNFKVSLSGDYMYIVWQDETLGVNGTADIFFKRSTDGGASFGNTINLSNNTGDSIRPEIAVSGSNIFIVWQNQATKGDNVFFKRSTDGGASFGDTINLSNSRGYSTNPEISVNNSSSVYTVWQNQASNNTIHDIFFRESTDGGASFGNIINLSNNQEDSTNPDIASANDGRTYVVWTDNIKGKSKVFFSVLSE